MRLPPETPDERRRNSMQVLLATEATCDDFGHALTVSTAGVFTRKVHRCIDCHLARGANAAQS